MLISIFWPEKIDLRGIYGDFMIIFSTKNSSLSTPLRQTPLRQSM
jgi:hypothetical protein